MKLKQIVAVLCVFVVCYVLACAPTAEAKHKSRLCGTESAAVASCGAVKSKGKNKQRTCGVSGKYKAYGTSTKLRARNCGG